MSRGNKAFSAGVGLFALAFAFVWVSPVSAALTSSESVAAVDNIAPDAPSNLEYEVDFAVPSVILTWDASPSDKTRQEPTGVDVTSGGSFAAVNDVTHYNIWRSELGGEPELIDDVSSGQLESYSYVDDSVESGVSYDYKVTADDGENESDGVESGPVTLGPPPNADIFPTDAIDFGEVAIDEVKSESITVSNSASDPEAILSSTFTVSGSDGFSATSSDSHDKIDVGDEATFTVSFDAAAVGNLNGDYEGVLTIRTNDPENRETDIELVASIVDGLVEPILDLSGVNFIYGQTLVGESKTRTLTITNKGDLALEADLSVDHVAFSVDVSEVTLAAEGSAEISIVFSPANTGDLDATITIASNDPIRPEVVVTVSGVAVIERTGARVEVVVDPDTGEEVEVVGFLDGDDDIDFEDFFMFADFFGTSAEDDGEDFVPAADLDGDGDVDFGDFFKFADFFGTDLGA